MSHAVIGMFDNAADASKARDELIAAGIAANDIQLSSSSSSSERKATAGGGYEDKGFWETLKEMFGGEGSTDTDRQVGYYTEATRRGGVILTVNTSDNLVERAADIMHSTGAVDVDAKAQEWRSSGWTEPNATMKKGISSSDTVQGAGKVNIVKEDLNVEKRMVNRGGVRIIKRVIERPVEQEVQLREEHVSVDRRAVDRALHGSEATEAFKDQTIELTESSEEAVATKTARVVGEVVVGKTVDNRTQKVRDTVRETDVQVEKLPGQSTSSTTKSIPDSDRTESTRTAKTGT